MKGTYCLIINLKKNENIKIGKLYKHLEFKKGYYVYIGSAMNSLIKRIERHFSHDKKMHWHIDYLLNNKNSTIEEVLFNISNKKVECDLAKIISKKGYEISKFGSSDCNCNSHLIYFEKEGEAIISIKKAYNELNISFNDLNYFKNNLIN